MGGVAIVAVIGVALLFGVLVEVLSGVHDDNTTEAESAHLPHTLDDTPGSP